MDTRRMSLQSVTVESDSNAGLWLDKFIAGQNRRGEAAAESSADKFKHRLIEETTKIETPDVYKFFFDRWQDSLDEAGAKFRSLEIDGRMIVGLGAESVLETSIALHRTYGVPFISGSALKGLAASYAHKHLGDHWKRETGEAHKFAFGSQDAAGFLTFHDALLLPQIKYALHADVMTVHHGEYYADKNVAPADWDNPVPIPFLSATGKYLAAISSDVSGADEWIEFVWLILEKALRKEGIGAKTSSGYGRAKLAELRDSEKTAKMRERDAVREQATRDKKLRKDKQAEQQEAERKRLQHEEYQIQVATQQEAGNLRRQETAEKEIKKLFGQINAIGAATKKPEDLFDAICRQINKIQNEERKGEHYVSVYIELERLKNKGINIKTTDKSGRKPSGWFDTLVKKGSSK